MTSTQRGSKDGHSLGSGDENFPFFYSSPSSKVSNSKGQLGLQSRTDIEGYYDLTLHIHRTFGLLPRFMSHIKVTTHLFCNMDYRGTKLRNQNARTKFAVQPVLCEFKGNVFFVPNFFPPAKLR